VLASNEFGRPFRLYKADVVNENKNNSAFVSLGLSVSVCCDVPCMIEIKTIPFY